MLTKYEQQEWVYALRHPDCKQAHSSLAHRDNWDADGPENYSYCCLGVYCVYILNEDPALLTEHGLPDGLAHTQLVKISNALRGLTNTSLEELDIDSDTLFSNLPAKKFEAALEDYHFDFYNDLTESEKEHRFSNGAWAFAYMNDTLRWSFARIANVIAALPTKANHWE